MILLQFGLAFMVLCFATADVSGGHLNPAVSIAFAVTQDIDVQRCAVYIICQCLGAVFGALFLKGACSFCVHSLANGRRAGMSACNDANSLLA